jgi:hypothetical protein
MAGSGDPVPVSLTPVAQWEQRVVERLAERRQRVLDSWRDLMMHLAVHDAVGLECPQLLDEHLLADAWEAAPQLPRAP